MEFTNEIVEIGPERRVYDDRFLDGTFPIQSGWQVEPRDGGSRIHWATEFEGRGLMRLLTSVLRRVIRQGQVQDLGKLQRTWREPDSVDELSRIFLPEPY